MQQIWYKINFLKMWESWGNTLNVTQKKDINISAASFRNTVNILPNGDENENLIKISGKTDE